MKKMIFGLALLLLCGACQGVPAFADEADSVEVYVTIADSEGKLAVVQEAVEVTDADGDGVLSISDALYQAHEAYYEGGAAAGYAASAGQYGLSMDKLWGTANGGSYGYCVNNTSATSLADPVQDGDFVSAYAYTDLSAWSDTYCYFDQTTVSVDANGSVTLTLMAAGYDAAWTPVTLPVEGATITLDGVATEYKTDANGKVTVTLADAGEVVISATSASQTLVPPACVATVSAGGVSVPDTPTVPVTGDGMVVAAGLSIAVLGGALLILCRGRRMYE